MRWCTFLHDIGKIAIHDAVLLKPETLTVDEQAMMRSHVERGMTLAAALVEQFLNVPIPEGRAVGDLSRRAGRWLSGIGSHLVLGQ